MEKKLKKELKDQWSENRFEEFKKLLKTAKAIIKTSSSKPNGPYHSAHRTPTPPSPPLPRPSPSPKPPAGRLKDENPKECKKGKEKEKGVEKSKKESKDGSKRKSKKGSTDHQQNRI